ncbi:MAG: phosphoglucosamine mutase [candidate division Zixibacteria bacterium]|nr:phosphoglucosamine mutase [candidate division Zixibacteria bacterium]
MTEQSKQLIKSTSGIRGVVGNGLDPVLVTQYGCAFGTLLKRGTVVIGRDSRPSGEMVKAAVISGLISVGIDVIDIGIVPTPTVEIAVKKLKAAGGICVTASHNPAQWNALKFFSKSGEFITAEEYSALDAIFNGQAFSYQPVGKLGRISTQTGWADKHIAMTLAVKAVQKAAIRKRRFKVVVDAINSAGSYALPALLEKLNAKVYRINCDGDGNFVHEPEPTPKNLARLGREVKRRKADLGMACDPDADRLALVDEHGRPISEEYSLTIAVQEVLRSRKGATVINLSTSKATADVAGAMGSTVHYSKVGESNVVAMMRQKKAVIGGEGNGGVIYPDFHAGRDSLIAAALTLSALSRKKQSLSELVGTFPGYYSIKGKASLPSDFTDRLSRFESMVESLIGPATTDRRDGLRFDFATGWLQIRSSNTEPIFRVIVETSQASMTETIYNKVLEFFRQ